MQNPPPGQRPVQPVLTYVDRPEVSETFADSLEKVILDGGVARLEFVVNRLDQPRPPAAPTGKKYTTCRLALPMAGLVGLANQLHGLMQALSQQGAFRQITPAPGSPSGKPN